MSNIVPIGKTGALTRMDRRRLDLFTKTVGKELRGPEIDEALEWCELYGANPFVKDIYFFVFDADKPDKRRVVPVLGIGLYRKIAARTGNYRPDESPPRFSYDDTLKSQINPKGMVWAEVSVHIFSHGQWHTVTSRLRWEERAPIKEIWAESESGRRKPTGKFELDPRKTNWATMPETMMAKCCEADAIRKAWPNETAGSYVAEEMDAGHTIDLTATEIIEQHRTEQKLAIIGGSSAVIIDWCDGKPLDRVPLGQVWDKALAWMRDKDRTSTEVRVWLDRNRHTRAEMKARSGADYLPWWTEVERTLNALEAKEQAAE